MSPRPRRFVPSDALSRALVTAGVAVLVVGLVVGAATPGASVSVPGDAGADQSNPAEVGSGEDLSAFERQLAERLAREARSDSVDLGSENYTEVRDQLNDSRYEALLDEYESVANETGNEDRTLAYRRMLDAQAAFVDAVERYQTTHDRYERLRNRSSAGGPAVTIPGAGSSRQPVAIAGSPADPHPERVDAVEIRRTAHELERANRRVERVGDELIERYWRLEDVSNESFRDQRASVRDRMLAVLVQQVALEGETLVATEVAVTEWTSTTSTADPLVVEGRLTANDAGVANATVELVLGGETATTRTDADGRFEVVHRPRTASPAVDRATVRYVPENVSVTAASERSVPVTVTRAETNATVTAEPDTVAYNDTLRVFGDVTAGTVGVDNATLVVRAGGRVVARNETGPNGTYAVGRSLPSRVPAGNQTVTVAVRTGDRPVSNTTANTTVTVVERTPRLSITAAQADGRTLDVAGNVTTAEASVDRHRVTVLVGGTRVGSARTGPDGSFETAVTVPSELVEQGLRTRTTPVDVTVVSPERGNLARTERATTVAVTTGNTALLVAGAMVAVLLVGGLARAVRRLRGTGAGTGTAAGGRQEADDDDGARAADDDSSGGDGSTGHPASATLVSAAGDLPGTDPEQAVRVGYAALRRHLEEREVDAAGDRTHWEFYRDCRDADLDEETLGALRDATEQYERAVYAADSLSSSAARETLAGIAALVDPDGERRAGGQPVGDGHGEGPPAGGG